ncbi:MAG TPA: hypothetical protein VNU68_27235 [Verrucomicrobiae bacterium]|nr:hypothetical protein [Verrucomicrobiae bacterium]
MSHGVFCLPPNAGLGPLFDPQDFAGSSSACYVEARPFIEQDMSREKTLPTWPDFADSSQARPALSLRLWPNRTVHKLLTLESALASAEPPAQPGSSRLDAQSQSELLWPGAGFAGFE